MHSRTQGVFFSPAVSEEVSTKSNIAAEYKLVWHDVMAKVVYDPSGDREVILLVTMDVDLKVMCSQSSFWITYF